MTKSFKKIYIAILFLLCLIPVKLFAADISFSSLATVEMGKNFEVLINIDSDGLLINSTDIALEYDKDLVSFSGYKTENTVSGIWIKSPSEENGSIYMNNIIPGGVSGLYDSSKNGLGPIPLVKLIFKAKKEGSAEFSFAKTQILQHDGLGTPLVHGKVGGIVKIKNSNTNTNESKDISDTEKPEPFTIIFLDSSVVDRTPSMIIFNTTDMSSGVKEYKINISGDKWTVVQSPYPVGKTFFSQYITIRAYDFADNFQESSIYIKGFLTAPILSIIFVLIILLCILGFKVIKYNRNET